MRPWQLATLAHADQAMTSHNTHIEAQAHRAAAEACVLDGGRPATLGLGDDGTEYSRGTRAERVTVAVMVASRPG